MTLIVAMVGTRRFGSLPPAVQRAYLRIATEVGRAGGIVRTGAAVGADQAGAEAALKAGGRVALVLPWASYELTWRRRIKSAYPGRVAEIIYTPTQHAAWADSVRQLHPAADKLSRGVFALHARNYGIVVGEKRRADIVVAVPLSTEPGKEGGTGQAIRVARAFGIRVINLTAGWKRLGKDRWKEAIDEAIDLILYH